jgi:hypothetical protein
VGQSQPPETDKHFPAFRVLHDWVLRGLLVPASAHWEPAPRPSLTQRQTEGGSIMKRAVVAAGIGALLIGGGATYSAVVASANSGGVSVVPWHGVAASSVSSEATPAITEPVALRVTLGSIAFHFTDEDSNGRFSVGDVFNFTERATSGGQAVGYDQVQCTVVFYQETLCTGALHLTGRGDLEIAGRVPNSRSFKIAITGGTGEFFNAQGEALLNEVDANTTTATIYLVN